MNAHNAKKLAHQGFEQFDSGDQGQTHKNSNSKCETSASSSKIGVSTTGSTLPFSLLANEKLVHLAQQPDSHAEPRDSNGIRMRLSIETQTT